jgi:peptide/nickel transport system permease protein
VSARYLLRRLAQVVPAVLASLIAAFLIVHAAPGDPILALAGEHGDAAYYAAIRAKFGLDRPIAEQLVTYLGLALRGDFGSSYVRGGPVVAVVLERVPATLALMTSAFLLSTVAGVAAGIAAGRGLGHAADLAVRAVPVVAHAIPPFWLAQIAAVTLALGTGLFPVQGLTDARRHGRGGATRSTSRITWPCPRSCSRWARRPS